MEYIEVRGKNVDEAIEKALKDLNVSREKVEIEVIQNESSGFLGLFGKKEAVIKATLIENPVVDAKDFLNKVFNAMNIESNLDIVEENNNLKIDMLGEEASGLIGYRGETLDSLQYLTNLVVNKGKGEDYLRVSIDTQNYREKRKETLRKLARKLARKAAKTNKQIKVEPMNPYERRIIHAELQGDRFVKTYSEGKEPYRRVVIEPKKKKA